MTSRLKERSDVLGTTFFSNVLKTFVREGLLDVLGVYQVIIRHQFIRFRFREIQCRRILNVSVTLLCVMQDVYFCLLLLCAVFGMVVALFLVQNCRQLRNELLEGASRND